MAELKARIAEIGKTLECPSGYTGMDAREDRRRLNQLNDVRRRGAVFTTAEDVEDAHLHARLVAHDRSPEGVGRERILKLKTKLFRASHSGREKRIGRPRGALPGFAPHPLIWISPNTHTIEAIWPQGNPLKEARNSK